MATRTMKIGLGIARQAQLRPISEIAASAGVQSGELDAAGRSGARRGCRGWIGCTVVRTASA
jgi:hypothetical protein